MLTMQTVCHVDIFH